MAKGREIEAIDVPGYDSFIQGLKHDVEQSRLQAAIAVNQALIQLYWRIGHGILEQQEAHRWGSKVIDRLAQDLRTSFPEMNGFSVRNLKYMRAFAEAYPDFTFVQAGPAQITWYHNCTLLDKVKESEQRIWYARKAVENGWTRDIMVHQIESNLFGRQGKALTNFAETLPNPQSELAAQVLKDPYIFDFLSIGEEALERDLERGLLGKLRDFLLELGTGFAFVGSQYHLEVGGEDFYLDLLFYHLKLRCFVVVDLKITDFKPEYAGKMGFYLSAVDEQLKHPDDGMSIGLILCKTKNALIAEYTLRNNQNPIGVSEYRLSQPLPQGLIDNLPTIEKLEKELGEAPFLTDVNQSNIAIPAETEGTRIPYVETEEFKKWSAEFQTKHRIYRDADLEKPEFIAAVEEASKLWKEECEEYLAVYGDKGSCVRDEGIKVRYLPPRARKWREKTIIWPIRLIGRVTGSLVWEHSADKIVDFLQKRGVDAFFDEGYLD